MKIVNQSGRLTDGDTKAHGSLKSLDELLKRLVFEDTGNLDISEVRSLESCLKSMVGEAINKRIVNFNESQKDAVDGGENRKA